MSDARQPRTGFIETNGTGLYYEMLGEGHPLVLLHGGYMDRRMWDDQFEVFARKYQVIRYDIRGFGKSAMPQVPYSHVEDLYALLENLDIKQACLLGLSLGGMIAIDFTLEHPEMVDALVLVGTAVRGFVPSFTEEQLEFEKQLAAPFIKAAEERDIPQLVEAVMSHPTLVPSPKYALARQRVRENLAEYSFVFVLDPAPMQEITLPAVERLSAIHVPVLIIVGDEDALMLHQIADKLEQDVPSTKRVGITDTHHMPNIEKPEAFNRIVLDFLGAL
ncbi:MAG TPA: alpha/beta fold hydrolase [Ktedonobacteraceae bacterium]|nr:alpha/beta fold hydrolase [Ktedonobacteraceae bacterium]